MLFIEKLFGPNSNAALLQILVVVFSICCHEYAHARAALWQGDSTAADAGHLTLNPLKQMGWLSLLMLAFLGFAWGMVPVDPARMKHRYSDALVAFAGPAVNLLLFLVMGLIFFVMRSHHFNNGPALFLFYIGALLNIFLFLFNLIPVPPLDGYTVFRFFFPGMFAFKTEFAKGIMIFLILAIFTFSKYLFFAAEWILTRYQWLYLYLTGVLHQ